MPRYTLVGFSHELDWRPVHFVEPIPAHRLCEVCGLLSKWTVFLPCRHVVCKMCYGECFLNEVYGCPLDGVQFREEDAQWMEFPVENLLKRKVKCWNEENGCDVTVNASDILKHFNEDCVHHSTVCPNCSAHVLCRSVCAHRRSKCSSHALANQAKHLEPSKDSDQNAMFTYLKTTLEERVGEMKSSLDQALRDHTTVCDRLNEVSHFVNALRETVIETSEKQTQAATIVVGQFKEDLAAQGGRLEKVVNRIGSLSEDAKVVADATRNSLQNLEQSNRETRRRIATHDNRLERVSRTVRTFEGVLDKALERATESMLQQFKTCLDFSAAASDVKESKLLAHKTLGNTSYEFSVNGIEELKQEALSVGLARFCCEPIYLRGYRIAPGLYLRKNESTLLVHARMQLYEGVIDEFLLWPFSHDVKATFMHPSSDKRAELSNNGLVGLENFGRPTESSNVGVYLRASLTLEHLEREGYVEFDRLCVKFELLPPTG